jgi:hypothetical protein
MNTSKTQHNTSFIYPPTLWGIELMLIPCPTNKVTYSRINSYIIVTGWNRHLYPLFKICGKPFFCKPLVLSFSWGYTKLPDTI